MFRRLLFVTFLVPVQTGDQGPPVPGGSDDPSRPHRCNDCTRRQDGRLDGSGSEWRDRTPQPRADTRDPDLGRTDDNEQDTPSAPPERDRTSAFPEAAAPTPRVDPPGHPPRPD